MRYRQRVVYWVLSKIDLPHKFYNEPALYPTMHHYVIQICIRFDIWYKVLHCGIFVWCIRLCETNITVCVAVWWQDLNLLLTYKNKFGNITIILLFYRPIVFFFRIICFRTHRIEFSFQDIVSISQVPRILHLLPSWIRIKLRENNERSQYCVQDFVIICEHIPKYIRYISMKTFSKKLPTR